MGKANVTTGLDEKLVRAIQQIAAVYAVDKIILFGSRARVDKRY